MADDPLLDDIMALMEGEGLTVPGESRSLSQRYNVLLRNSLRRAIRDSRVAVIYEGTEIVALSHWTSPDPSGSSELVGIITRSTHRGRGYAALLMRDICRMCRTLNIKRLVSYTQAEDQMAASMHQFFGFELAGTVMRPHGPLLKWEREMSMPFTKGPQDCTYTEGDRRNDGPR